MNVFTAMANAQLA